MNRIGLWISTLLLGFVLFSSTVFVVDQRQFGVVYALGANQRSDHRARLALQVAAAPAKRQLHRQAFADAGQP